MGTSIYEPAVSLAPVIYFPLPSFFPSVPFETIAVCHGRSTAPVRGRTGPIFPELINKGTQKDNRSEGLSIFPGVFVREGERYG